MNEETELPPNLRPNYSTATEFHTRPYIRVGNEFLDSHRGVVMVDAKEQIENALMSAPGYTLGKNYTIANCTLTLTVRNGFINVPIRAFMLPLDSNPDESITWYTASRLNKSGFENEGGDIEPLAENIVVFGRWKGNTISFDITPYMSIWKNSGKSRVGIILAYINGMPDAETFFHSSESTTPLIGGKSLTNCKFLAGGDTNTVSTEGVRVKITKTGAYHTISPVDTSSSGSLYWSILNASASVGDSFTLFSPDTEQKIVIGTAVCTIHDKLESEGSASIVVSGISIGNETEYYTTAEFSATATIPTGSGILEFTQPDQKLLFDLSTLQKNDPVYVNYRATTTPNNAKSYTLNFYADETLKNNRARLYFNESAVSENRTGLLTEIKTQGVQPQIKLSLLV